MNLYQTVYGAIYEYAYSFSEIVIASSGGVYAYASTTVAYVNTVEWH